jgi:NADPH:quinone reductase-like Zn-dependent oxidoreductase
VIVTMTPLQVFSKPDGQRRFLAPFLPAPRGTRRDQGQADAPVLRRIVREVEAGIYRPNVDRIFGLDDIVAAHRYMENNQATGKLVMMPL